MSPVQLKTQQPVARLELSGEWNLEWLTGPADAPAEKLAAGITAVVPGQVHTDLLRAGVLSQPDIGYGERDQAWVGHSTWRYWRTFEWVATDGHVELVADGLDTFAEVQVNGTTIATTNDQHIAYRWDIAPYLIEGDNRIDIVFASAWERAYTNEAKQGPLPTPYDEPYQYVRKSAANFGWDWGPHYVTAGIWQPIAIETWQARVAEVLVNTTLTTAGAAQVVVAVDTAGEVDDAVMHVVLRAPNGDEAFATDFVAPAGASETTIVVDNPELWWPVGYGAQPLYTLDVELRGAETVLDSWSRRIGLREVALQTPADELGEQWALVINGTKIRVRGYNWIPEDPFIAEVTDERLAQRLDQTVDGNANMLRVWGGGYFVTEAFLNGCDERGILVWHDFLFACAGYDESAEARDLIELEARQAIARMTAHPSLVLWCGGNETIWGFQEWGWQDQLGETRAWGDGYYRDLLPQLVAELAPATPYVPNSPFSTIDGRLMSDPSSGPTHLWDMWNNRDYTNYREVQPAFISEMGWCAPPATTTLRGAVTEGELLPSNPQVVFHMRASDGMHKLAKGLTPYFPVPQTEQDWIFRTQLVQARAQKVGTEWLRSVDRCSGVLIWQINDCWPVLSWSAVDSEGIEKPVWFALRDAFAPQLMSLQPVTPGGTQDPTGPDGLEVVVVNDSAETWSGEVNVARVGFDGTSRAQQTLGFTVGPGQNARLAIPAAIGTPDSKQAEFLVADAAGQRSVWLYLPDRQCEIPPAAYEVTTSSNDSELTVTVTATCVVLDLCLLTDLVADAFGLPGNALISDSQLVTLLPGESHTFRVTAREAGTAIPQDGAPVASALRAANATSAP